MEKYEGTLLQELLTVPIHFVWWFLFIWLAVISGLIYLACVI